MNAGHRFPPLPRAGRSLFLGLCCLLCASGFAHPEGGLVIDTRGNLFFGYIYPLTGTGHHGCLWRLDPQGELLPWYKSAHANSHMYIAPNPSGEIHVLQRNFYSGAKRFETQLWKLDGKQDRKIVTPTFLERNRLGKTFLVTAEGNLIYAASSGLHIRSTDGKSERLAGGQRGRRDGKGINADFERLEALTWGPDGRIYVLDAGRLRTVTLDGLVTTRSDDMFLENPEYLPQKSMNVFLDLAVAPDGTAYVAYYGNRRVLRVLPEGKSVLFLDSGPQWGPLGVAVGGDGIYVLEDRFPVEGNSLRLRWVGHDGTITSLFD